MPTLPAGFPTIWVPDACTLPTSKQARRLTDFDELFAASLEPVRRVSPRHLQVVLTAEPEVAERAAGLAAREAACCGFFTFTLGIKQDELTLDVTVPERHTRVLSELADRAEAARADAARTR